MGSLNPNNIIDDLKHTHHVLKTYSSKYEQVYFRTNECLSGIFKNIELREKNVLSVLSSGDQAFHLIKNGAKSVDLFDINKLTIYYFYLRIWTIKYLKFYYPKNMCNDFIKELLKYVKPKTDDEKVAYLFWNKFLDSYSEQDIMYLFMGTTSTNKMQDVRQLRRKLKKFNFNFYNVDISHKIDIDKKYDLIYVSNINEWLEKSRNSFLYYRDNLNDLLNVGGMVVCYTLESNRYIGDERELFNKYFEYRTLPDFKEDKKHRSTTVGYVYIKK